MKQPVFGVAATIKRATLEPALGRDSHCQWEVLCCSEQRLRLCLCGRVNIKHSPQITS
jgi:hypothetical protein